VFISPLSASMSLGMTLNGARAGTFDAMRSALQFGTTSQADINGGYKSLISLLRGLDPGVDFKIANSIWHRNGMTFSPPFLDAGKTYFDAAIQGLDFTKVDASKATINDWVSDQTNAKIPAIIDDITSDDVMFLINAIYFKGIWRSRFDPNDTRPGDFRSAAGAKQSAQFMMLNEEIRHSSTNGVEAVDLPYGNAAFTMTVVLPPAGVSADEFSSTLTATQWEAIVAGLHGQPGTLWMPKLRLTYARTMNDDLTALGMGVAFTGRADFSGMAGSPGDLEISYVKQKAYVDINEEGTEAAAVTVTGIKLVSAPVPFTLRFDRPYLFVIRERLSGTILFMAKINTMP
jgi:serine protease inhibitor